ncbi:MAG: prepilin-type N-terminal cleavage/methylation domain-containing protein [Myxococcota bacterium]
MSRRGERGFTLMEVMIALLILALSLAVLMQAQASSLAKAAKARDLTIATLLARSKMIDIEQEVFDEGFTQGEQREKGDFDDDGYPEITWEYRLVEIDLDIGMLNEMAAGFGGGDDAGGDLGGAGGIDSILGSVGGLVEPMTQRIADAVRLCELTVHWPEGKKYKGSFTVKTLLTREGFAFAGGAPAVAGADQTAPDDTTDGDTTPGTTVTAPGTNQGAPVR